MNIAISYYKFCKMNVFLRVSLFAMAIVCLIVTGIRNVHAGASLSLGVGYGIQQHNFMTATSRSKTPLLIASLDTRGFRLHRTGLLARGPFIHYSKSSNVLQQKAELPIFHWHHLHGLWLSIETLKLDSSVTLTRSATYIAQDDSQLILPAGLAVSSTLNSKKYRLFWRDDSRFSGIINEAGLYTFLLTTPAAAKIDHVIYDLYDSNITGHGVFIGFAEDKKGLNFKWEISLGEATITYSEGADSINQLSKSDRRQNFFEIALGLNFRYYLSPYWYLLSQFQLNAQVIVQSQTNTNQITHDPYVNQYFNSQISLRRYF